MDDVDHTRPHDSDCLGDGFCRGPRRLAADGGRRETDPESESTEPSPDERVTDPEASEPTMREVSHTPPTGDGANDVFKRGEEESPSPVDTGSDSTVESAGEVDENTQDGDDHV